MRGGCDLQGMEDKASKWLRDMFHNIHENDANTHWLTDDIFQALRAYWDLPEFKVKAWASRGSARGGSLHTEDSLPLRARG